MACNSRCNTTVQLKKRHCEHCLTKTINKRTPEEKSVYYHQILEAKLVLGDDMIISLATEFIENPKANCK